MNKTILLAGLLAAVTSAALFAQASFGNIPPDWDTNPPQDTAERKYAVGISQPSASEQDAVKGALQHAVQQIASGISTRFQGQTDIIVQSQAFSSDIEDAFTVTVETSSFSTNVPITGVTEIARKIEKTGGFYIVRILASISTKDYNKAKQYIDNEEAAFLAYRHFAQRGLFQLDEKPAGFQDYYSWLRNTCVIISIDSPDSIALLEQMDLFIKKLYKNAAVFAQIIDGKGSRIIYNSGKYYDGILRALQNTSLFTVERESSHLMLKPSGANVFGGFKNSVAAMKDSGKFVIIGLEKIETQSGGTVNQGAIVINQFRTMASRLFNMQAVHYTIPSQYISDYIDEDGIIRYIQNNSASFPARYLIICRSQTTLSAGIPEYKIPPMVNASCHFTVYDIVTGETMQSDTAETNAGAFTLSDLSDRAVIEESRRALQFLYNAKTKPGLAEIMSNIFLEL